MVEELDDAEISKEHRVWKKNAPFLYDMCIVSTLLWPSLTVQWFPDVEIDPSSNYAKYRLLLGSYTSGAASEYLQIADIDLPQLGSQMPDLNSFDNEKNEFGIPQSQKSNLRIIQRIIHDKGEVNRARYMPQKPDIIGTCGLNGVTYIYDRTKHPSVPNPNGKPELTLKHHHGDTFGISWNLQQEGSLLTGSEDTTIALWNIKQWRKNTSIIGPSRVFRGHNAQVNDIQWYKSHDSLFASVADDCSIRTHDVRLQADSTQINLEGHKKPINAISFNPFNEYLFATGSEDKSIALWDLRRFDQKIHSMVGHQDSVSSLEWSPHNSCILASASISDRRVMLWDVSRINDPVTDESELAEGPPELLFIHGGHSQGVMDINWNPREPWTMCSVGADNEVQIWRPAASIIGTAGDAQLEKRTNAA